VNFDPVDGSVFVLPSEGVGAVFVEMSEAIGCPSVAVVDHVLMATLP